MTLKNYLGASNFTGVSQHISKIVGTKDLANYKILYDKLLKITPEGNHVDILYITRTFNKVPSVSYWEADCLHGVCTYLSWKKWLSLTIRSGEDSPDYIVAVCLIEMTKLGFTEEEVKEKEKEIADIFTELAESIK